MSYDLYGGKPPHVEGNTASEEAAEAIEIASMTLRGDVYRYLKRRKNRGATCCDVEHDLRMRHQTASARIRELVLKGRVVDSGRQRRTDSFRFATVWVVKSR